METKGGKSLKKGAISTERVYRVSSYPITADSAVWVWNPDPLLARYI